MKRLLWSGGLVSALPGSDQATWELWTLEGDLGDEDFIATAGIWIFCPLVLSSVLSCEL